MSKLSYPLSKKSLSQAFADLNPESIAVGRPIQGYQEAVVDGAWSLSRLRSHLKRLGFKAAGSAEQLLFVNEGADVGVQLMGAVAHPTMGRWISFSVELQARRSAKVTPRVHFS